MGHAATGSVHAQKSHSSVVLHLLADSFNREHSVSLDKWKLYSNERITGRGDVFTRIQKFKGPKN